MANQQGDASPILSRLSFRSEQNVQVSQHLNLLVFGDSSVPSFERWIMVFPLERVLSAALSEDSLLLLFLLAESCPMLAPLRSGEERGVSGSLCTKASSLFRP